MWTYNHTDELCHYGVLGMKWGKRRYQNADGSLTAAGKRRQREDIRTERKRLKTEEYNRLVKEYDLEGKREAAYKYGVDHGRDLDDGGGGSRGRAAGEKYLEMHDEVDRLDDLAHKKAAKYANDKIISKFGKLAVDELNAHDEKVRTSAFVATFAGIELAAIGTVVGLIATDLAGKKK